MHADSYQKADGEGIDFTQGGPVMILTTKGRKSGNDIRRASTMWSAATISWWSDRLPGSGRAALGAQPEQDARGGGADQGAGLAGGCPAP